MWGGVWGLLREAEMKKGGIGCRPFSGFRVECG